MPASPGTSERFLQLIGLAMVPIELCTATAPNNRMHLTSKYPFQADQVAPQRRKEIRTIGSKSKKSMARVYVWGPRGDRRELRLSYKLSAETADSKQEDQCPQD